MTYGAEGTGLEARVRDIRERWPRMSLVVRGNDQPSLRIDLEDRVDH
jgi:hypothetical protein